jgi:diacylglycerol kinase family enzyme
VLIVNEGSRSGPAEMDAARLSLEAEGLPLHAAEMVRGETLRERTAHWKAQGADLIIVGGGDGTLRLAAEELRDGDTTLGILPLGTGNNFARDLGIPLLLPDACRTIARGRTRRVEMAVAEFEDGERKLFINAAHVGLFGLANPKVDPELKRRYGYFAYAIGAWRAYREFNAFRLRVTAGETTKRWTAVQASAILGRVYAGGVGEIPGETLEEERMNLTVLETDAFLRWASMAWGLIRSRSSRSARAHRFRLHEACLVAEPPQEVNLDGEILGRTPVTFRVCPQVLRVIIGEHPMALPSPGRRTARVAGGVALGLLAVLAGAYLWRRAAAEPPEEA